MEVSLSEGDEIPGDPHEAGRGRGRAHARGRGRGRGRACAPKKTVLIKKEPL